MVPGPWSDGVISVDNCVLHGQFDSRLRRCPECEQAPGGDPAEVRPADSRAESQSELNGPGGSPTSPPGRDFDARYHVPRSQVWEGSRGRQRGLVHLHVTAPFVSGRISRNVGQALCGQSGWYERPANPGEERCPRCVEIASRPRAAVSQPGSGA